MRTLKNAVILTAFTIAMWGIAAGLVLFSNQPDMWIPQVWMVRLIAIGIIVLWIVALVDTLRRLNR